MPITITFTTDTLTKDEAVGLFALLDTIRPDAFDPGLEITSEVKEEEIAERVPVEDQIAPTPPDAPERDSRGLPWHADIHAGSKALNADGTWRTKRGVDKALVESVEAELRANGVLWTSPADGVEITEPTEDQVEARKEFLDSAIVAPPSPPAPPAPSAPLAAENATVAPTPPATSTPDVSPTSAISPFVTLMKRVTTAQGSGKLTPARVQELLASIDKNRIMDLRTDDDAQAAFRLLLDEEGV